MAIAESTITVNLGPHKARVEELVRSGQYASAQEVIWAGLDALDFPNDFDEAEIIRLAEEAAEDPRPRIPAEQVFRELRAKYGLREAGAAH